MNNKTTGTYVVPQSQGIFHAIKRATSGISHEQLEFRADAFTAALCKEYRKKHIAVTFANFNENGMDSYVKGFYPTENLPDGTSAEDFIKQLKRKKQVHVKGRYQNKQSHAAYMPEFDVEEITFQNVKDSHTAFCEQSISHILASGSTLDPKIKTQLNRWQKCRESSSTSPHFDFTQYYSTTNPRSVKTIHLITAIGSQGYYDFVKSLKKDYSPTSIEVAEYTAPMSHFRSIDTIVEHIKKINADLAGDPCLNEHLIVIVRGGGDSCELANFNFPKLVNAILESQVPVCTAIGHYSDTHLCDVAAQYSYSTPSVAGDCIQKGLRSQHWAAQNKKQKAEQEVDRLLAKKAIAAHTEVQKKLNRLQVDYQHSQEENNTLKQDIIGLKNQLAESQSQFQAVNSKLQESGAANTALAAANHDQQVLLVKNQLTIGRWKRNTWIFGVLFVFAILVILYLLIALTTTS